MESETAQTGQCVVRNEPGCQVCQTNFETENPRRRLRSEPRAARPLRLRRLRFVLYGPLASRTDLGLQHPSTTFLSRGRLLKHTRTPH